MLKSLVFSRTGWIIAIFEHAKKLMRDIKVINKTLTSHIFRHTLVSRLAEYNVPLKTIMQRVGHSDSKTTIKIYTHITKKLKANVANILEHY